MLGERVVADNVSFFKSVEAVRLVQIQQPLKVIILTIESDILVILHAGVTHLQLS